MKILVAIDGSEFSKNAVRFASCLAMKIKAEVIALRINDIPRYSHWMGISNKVKEEMFESSEKMIQEAVEIGRAEFDMASNWHDQGRYSCRGDSKSGKCGPGNLHGGARCKRERGCRAKAYRLYYRRPDT